MRYHVEDGAIVNERGGVLYESDSIRDLSDAARVRLALLHTQHPDLSWEGDGVAEGAWDILIREGLMK